MHIIHLIKCLSTAGTPSKRLQQLLHGNDQQPGDYQFIHTQNMSTYVRIYTHTHTLSNTHI